MRVRLLTESDVPQAFELSSETGWNQTVQDWRIILTAGAGTCFGVESEGTLAATATLICYGNRLAWVGMVLTRPPDRGKGYARILVERILLEADNRGIETVKLDATDQGRPIYQRFGFIAEQEVQRWSGESLRGTGVNSAPNAPIPLHLDVAAFGANRKLLLEQLGPPEVSPDGFVLTRPGRLARYLGPCVARSPKDAGLLISAALGRHSGSWFWDILPANQSAVDVATSLGFSPTRQLVRMYRGRPLKGEESNVYALAGFEFG